MKGTVEGWHVSLGNVVYVLCALTSLACAVLLVRAYLRSRSQLLLFSSICFSGLFLNNVLVIVDEMLTSPDVSLLLARDITYVGSGLALVIGLVWSTRGGT